MPKATWKKDAKKCAKKRFGLEIWCSWLRFRRPGARPGRPKSVPRAAQDGPKIWGRVSPAPFVTLLGALGHFFAFFCDFVRILYDFSSIFVRILVNFASIFNGKRKQSKQPKQAKASKSKQKQAKGSQSKQEPARVEVQNQFHTWSCLLLPGTIKCGTDFELKL